MCYFNNYFPDNLLKTFIVLWFFLLNFSGFLQSVIIMMCIQHISMDAPLVLLAEVMSEIEDGITRGDLLIRVLIHVFFIWVDELIFVLDYQDRIYNMCQKYRYLI